MLFGPRGREVVHTNPNDYYSGYHLPQYNVALLASMHVTSLVVRVISSPLCSDQRLQSGVAWLRGDLPAHPGTAQRMLLLLQHMGAGQHPGQNGISAGRVHRGECHCYTQLYIRKCTSLLVLDYL